MALPGLTTAQVAFVHAHLGDGVVLVRDMSWHQVDTIVLHVRAAAIVGVEDSDSDTHADVVVKAASGMNGLTHGRTHLERELIAHQNAVAPLVTIGRTGRMIAGNIDTAILLLEYQPGVLVEGTPAEVDAGVHEEAGRLLRIIHADSEPDSEMDARVTHKALEWLDTPHRLPPAHAEAARRILEARLRDRPTVEVVHTHGDWHPRNWLIDGDGDTGNGTLRVIDWGRYDRRPAYTDLVRCAAQQWRDNSSLGDAFVRGYGSDPRASTDWAIERLRQAVGTACWARSVKDDPFEAQGWRMVREALQGLGEQVE